MKCMMKCKCEWWFHDIDVVLKGNARRDSSKQHKTRTIKNTTLIFPSIDSKGNTPRIWFYILSPILGNFFLYLISQKLELTLNMRASRLEVYRKSATILSSVTNGFLSFVKP